MNDLFLDRRLGELEARIAHLEEMLQIKSVTVLSINDGDVLCRDKGECS